MAGGGGRAGGAARAGMAELGELEGKLRDVGEKLQSPPDDVDALLKLIHVSLSNPLCAGIRLCSL